MTNKMKMYTDWDSSVAWSWGITSTIRTFKEGFSSKKHQTINYWLYE